MPKVVVDEERCKGCALCVQVCPPDVLAIGFRLNTRGFYPVVLLDDNRCTSCAVCALICPDVALTVYKPVKAAAGAHA